MSDDLLRFVFGPQPYSSWWLWLAVVLTLVIALWYTTVFVWTLPAHRLRRMPGVRGLHATLIRRRFARTVQRIADEHDTGEVSAPAACAAIGRTVRSFLHQATGTPAQYLHVGAIADGNLAAAAPLVTQLGDAQFNADSDVDVAAMSARAQELIRSWT